MRLALILSEAAGELTQREALTLARTLRTRGHAVTLIAPQTGRKVQQPAHALAWSAEGFPWIPVSAGFLAPDQEHFPRDPGFLTARALAKIVLAFDAAWFFESEWAMPTLRERRFADRRLPVVALHAEPEPTHLLTTLDQINRSAAREYAAKFADLISPPTEQAIQKIEDLIAGWQQNPTRTSQPPTTYPAVTVCIPYFEAPQYLAETLLSLEHQTSKDFTVLVVDDGSHTPAAIAAFDTCAARYSSRGWRFLRQANQSSGAARNRAAKESRTEFLLFLDSDDLAMPNMVERFLRAALLTGDDCLVVPNYGFHEDPTGPCAVLYDPPGGLIGSMGDDMHGGSCIFIRKDAFLKLDGFTEVRGVGFEDYELHIRANLQGLRWDVLPELIYRYRMPRAGGVSRSTSAYPNLARVLRWYEERLRPTGLGQLPLAFASAYWRQEKATETVTHLETTLNARRASHSPQGRELKLLLLACNFPFGLVSGWHNRVQQMIRYFGSRYELTLITQMPREEIGPSRRQAFENLRAILGIEGSDHSAPVAIGTPFRVRQHYTDTFQTALRNFPSDQYHAAIMDQIFMAEFRKDLDTLPILTEHNIESRLLRQASERSWSSDLPEAYRNALIEAERLEHYEDHAWRDFPLRAAVSEADRAQIDQRAPGGRTVVAPNGADLATWLPNAKFEAATVLFAGHLAYLPNVDGVGFLLTEIWPRVQRQLPHARLLIAGRAPSGVVHASFAEARAAGLRNIELIPSPHSMDTVAEQASITIAPLRLGSGTRCKILDSMAWGLPVVSTTLGAEGIDAIDEEHLLIRDDPAQFADAIVRLLSDRILWQKCRDQSRELVRARYSWDKVFEPLEDALLQLIP